MNAKEKSLLNALKKFYGDDQEKLYDMVIELVEKGDVSYDSGSEFLSQFPTRKLSKEDSSETTRAQTVMPAYDSCAPPYSGAIRHQPSCDTTPVRKTDPCGGGGSGRISSC